MALWWGKSKYVNIVVKDHAIRYVEVKLGHPPEVKRWGERALPVGVVRDGRIVDGETLAMILDECVEEWKIDGHRARFVVPDPFVMIRSLPLPSHLSDEEIRGYLFLELGESIPLPFADPVFDYVVMERTSEAVSILLFAAPEEAVSEYAALLEEADLRPVAADVSPLCAYRPFYAAGQAAPDDHILLVQFDESAVNLSVFHRHLPLFMRHLPLEAYRDRTAAIVDPFVDVYKEMERIMSFYSFSLQQGKQSITRLFLAGDHPELGHVFTALTERLEMPVERLSASLDPLPDRFHLAWGLALKEGRADDDR
ncbi:type IV pilus biogenesis protein PilM [Geobacillus sp. WSUCF-018B]|uniref:type IV pilus biogenesis protein PilM n=1 Tax=Geobacillus sp. WSUCF-018B TaxID=2055939 RepID=UPI000C28E816|nr:pilus assembly protein PilM [Geobacillus sp. WSUCF-018B]PJW18839.1 pilus assembly protein PilM [Geobacillus sp. WSUCF-018B]